MQYPDLETQRHSPNDDNARELHDTSTTREHGWVDDDWEDFASEDHYDDHPAAPISDDPRPVAHDHVRRLDDGHIFEPRASYTPYETEDPFTYGAERGYASSAGRGPGRRDRF
ncbi:MAG: hypothetical protein Q8O67_07610 [Deltaproteobacteria bacterium]|nr:hypothetical protein [Deltaproteobacteria bacterium]